MALYCSLNLLLYVVKKQFSGKDKIMTLIIDKKSKHMLEDFVVHDMKEPGKC
jgi:hypothetical protein